MKKEQRHKITLIFATCLGLSLAFIVQTRALSALTACRKPWIFFDLGNTLVDSKSGKDMKYLSGAREYLKELKHRGFRIGIITNVPEQWGPSSKQKIQVLKKTVQEAWSRDPSDGTMDWNDFADTLILTPPQDLCRKPAPYLFKSAISKMVLEEGETHCRVVFQGEDPIEIAAANREGMVGHLIQQDDLSHSFIPISTLEAMQCETTQ